MKQFPKLSIITIILIVSAFTLVSWQAEAWEPVVEQDGVKVSSMKESMTQDGILKEHIILRIENTTSEPVVVSWYLKTWYGGTCRSCSLDQPNEYNKHIYLKPGQVLTGFSSKGEPQLRIFHGFPERPETSVLTAFELADFNVRVE
jgi:hypothetical protein